MPYEKNFENNLSNIDGASGGKKIEPISEYYEVKESDKREGIPVYGDKPLGGEKLSFDSGFQSTAESLRREIEELEKIYKSSDYVGDKGEIEKRILSKEDELRGLGVLGDGKLKTAKELAMEGKIAWDKGSAGELQEKSATTDSADNKLNAKKSADVKTAEVETNTEASKAKTDEKIVEKIEDDLRDKIESTKKETELKEKDKKTSEHFEKETKKVEEPKPEKKEDVDVWKLKAAEVLCLVDLRSAKKEEYVEILKKLEKEYSRDVIEKAARVAELREKGAFAYEQAIKEQKTSGKEKSLSQIAKDNQRAGKREYDFFERNNFYDPAIIDLKVALLNDKEEYLWKEIEGDPVLSKLSVEEKNADINRKLLEYEATYLSRLVITEKSRDQEIRAEIHFAEKMKSAGILKKSFTAFARLPRGVRSVIGAAVFGAGVAVFAPSFVIGAVPTYLGYRAWCALFGGTIAAGLQKLFGNKVVNAAYEKDVNKSFSKLTKQIRGDEEFRANGAKAGGLKGLMYKVFGKKEKLQDLEESKEKAAAEEKEIEEGLKGLKDLIAMRKYEEIAKLNMKIAEKQLKELEKHAKFRRWNTVAMMTATGIIGGVAGANLFDYLAGPKVAGAILESKTSRGPVGVPPEEDIIMKKPPPEILPTEKQLELSTVGRGEGVEHVLRRQLEVDPTKWSFKGDAGNVAVVREWSGIRAHQIAIDEGYVNPKTGFETRVLDMGPEGPKGNPAYILGVDSSGKPSVREFFEGKPTGGKGVMNVYEYGYKRPSMSEILEQKKIETPVPAVEEMTARPVETLQAIPEPAAAEPVVTRPSGFGSVAAAVEAPTVGLSKAEIISSLKEDMQPVFERGAQNFGEFSLLKQEQLLNSREMYDFEQYMRSLKGMPNLTDADAELMGEMNKYWSQMAGAYSENLKEFSGAVREATGLASEKGVDVFLNTKIGSVWNSYRGDDQILNFVKSVNPAADELARNLTIGEILKSRFIDGEFTEMKIAGAPGWVE